MAQVWSDSKQSEGTLLVALALADFANDSGECWAKNDTLAEKARLSKRQVQSAISTLIKDGEIEKTATPNGKRNCNTYRFLNLQGTKPTSRDNIAGEAHCTPDTQSTSSQGCSPLRPLSVKNGAQNIDVDVCYESEGGREPPVEPSVEPSYKVNAQPAAAGLCKGLPPCPEETSNKRRAFAIFTALCESEGVNGSELGKIAAGRIWAAVREFMSFDPSITTENEILRRASIYRRVWPKATFTSLALAANWHRFKDIPMDPGEPHYKEV